MFKGLFRSKKENTPAVQAQSKDDVLQAVLAAITVVSGHRVKADAARLLKAFPLSEEIKAARRRQATVEAEAADPRNFKIGQEMPDGTKFAGFSPGTGKAMYAVPRDEPLLMDFNSAAECAKQKSLETGQAYRVPSIAELDQLARVCAIIGGFNLSKMERAATYWSSTEPVVRMGLSKRLYDGTEWLDDKLVPCSVRLVRS